LSGCCGIGAGCVFFGGGGLGRTGAPFGTGTAGVGFGGGGWLGLTGGPFGVGITGGCFGSIPFPFGSAWPGCLGAGGWGSGLPGCFGSSPRRGRTGIVPGVGGIGLVGGVTGGVGRFGSCCFGVGTGGCPGGVADGDFGSWGRFGRG
jgi:hypothetical protein